MPNPILGYWHRLYHNPTPSESALEPVIASLGIVYRFQHPLSPFIADFAFPTLGIVLEVDGSSHRSPAAVEKDAVRDQKLLARGWRTVRVQNEWAVRATADELRTVLGLLPGTAV